MIGSNAIDISCLHGDGTHKRTYIYVDDVASAFDIILHAGLIGEAISLDSIMIYINDRIFQELRIILEDLRKYRIWMWRILLSI